MIRIGVCDDSREFLLGIKQMLSNREGLLHNVCVELFSSGDALLLSARREPFDIVILDMIMPQRNGIELARQLRRFDSAVRIVFLTSSSEFAVESYSVKASDYILKPVTRERLLESINSLMAETAAAREFITVKGRYSSHTIPMSRIEYAEAQGKTVVFNTVEGKSIETAEPLYAFDGHLCKENGFMKCHRSYIVNVAHIERYTGTDITMRSGARIPIARSCRKGFEELYFSIIFGKEGELK